MKNLSRRHWIRQAATTVAAATLPLPSGKLWADAPGGKPVEPRTVAAVITEYRHNSHADVLLTKILEGWKHDGGPGPALKLVSLYADQFPAQDMARSMSKKHGFPIHDTIEKAITLGGNRVAVDGVISIGEHGDYPWNKLEQHLYPRRRFFEAITNTFEKYGKVVPVFNDKHLGPAWEDAKWMFDRAVQLRVPFMAGSSLPVAFRSHPIDVPMGSPIEAVVGIGYSGLDIYGSHALNCYQWMAERRPQAEKGVKSVQCLQGKDVWDAVDQRLVDPETLDAAFQRVAKPGIRNLREEPNVTLFLFEYIDGFKGAQLMMNNVVRTAIGVRLAGGKVMATSFEERPEPRYPHFAYLLKSIERMIHRGIPSYPVERVLLTSGILDRALTSRHLKSKKLDTPELAIAYRPVDYPWAPKPDLLSSPLEAL